MSLKVKIETEYKNALKAKDKTKISTYRLILSSIKDLDISNRSGPNKKETDDEDIKKLCNEIDDICTKQKTYRGQLIAYNKSNNVEKAKEHKALLAELKIKRKELEKNIDQYKYKVVDDIQDCYEKMGYTVYKKILNCSHYGCATSRRRLFIVAVRNDLDIKKEETGKFSFSSVFPDRYFSICSLDFFIRPFFIYIFYLSNHFLLENRN